MGKKKLPRQLQTAESLLADTQKLIDLMVSASDLAVAIVAHSFLDYADLQKLGKIRNRFAHHHIALDFGDKQIGELCDALSLPRDTIDATTGKPIKMAHLPKALRIRNRYLMMSVYLSQQFLRRSSPSERSTKQN